MVYEPKSSYRFESVEIQQLSAGTRVLHARGEINEILNLLNLWPRYRTCDPILRTNSMLHSACVLCANSISLTY